MHSRGKRLECPAWPQSQPGDHASRPMWAGSRYPESTPTASSAASQRPLLGDCVRNITGSFLPNRKPSPTCTTDTQGCLHPMTRGHRWSSGLLTTHVKRAQAETLCRAGSRKDREELAVLTSQGSRAPLLCGRLGCHRNLRGQVLAGWEQTLGPLERGQVRG